MIKTIFKILVLTFFLSNCSDKKGKQSPPKQKDAITVVKVIKDTISSVEKSTPESGKVDTIGIQSLNIKGTWSVKKHQNSKSYAMTQEEMDEWVHRKFIISDSVYFEFDKIPAYADLFKGENLCSISNLGQPDLVEAEDYFDVRFDPLEELGVLNSTLKIYRTTCRDHPLNTFVLTKNNEILILWDGIYFVLTKDSKDVVHPNNPLNRQGKVDLPLIGQYDLSQMKIESRHKYGAGDWWGNISRYTTIKGTIAIDSSFYGEYGYAITHFKFGPDTSLEAVHTIDWNSTPSEDTGDYIYILTEKTIDFKTAQATVMQRKDTVADHFSKTGAKIYTLKKPFIKVNIIEEQNTYDYWVKKYHDTWKNKLSDEP